jgi:gliding motility-associated peptidyl-prolyl isomerase
MKNILLFILISLLLSCGAENDKKQIRLTLQEEEQLKESILKNNQQNVGRESEKIDAYVADNNLSMKITGTGLRYMITKTSNGKTAKPEMLAKVEYKISLLDGTDCYSSDSTGAVTFRIDHDDVESGLHEGIKLLRVGEHAKFILPSHLAYGLTGYQNKIPPRTPIIYDIKLIQLN